MLGTVNIAFRSALIVAPALCVLGGCATIPDVTVQFYFPKALTQLQLIESVACDSSKRPYVVASVLPTTAYSNDIESRMGTLQYSKVSGPFSDAELSITLTDDGRLSGVNQTSTGQGDVILKDILALAAVAGMTFRGTKISDTQLCDALTLTAGGAGKAVSFTYKALIDYRPTNGNPYDPGDPAAVFVVDDNSGLYQDLLAWRGGRTYSLAVSTDPAAQAAARCDDSRNPERCKLTALFGNNNCQISQPYIELNRFVATRVEVKKPTGDTLWKAELPIPVRGGQDVHYCLPMPPAPLFGGQTFVIQLSAYGSIQKLEYGKKTGAHDAADATTALANALKGPTAATQAAMLKAQADVIAQQRRLVQCQADPTNCKP